MVADPAALAEMDRRITTMNNTVTRMREAFAAFTQKSVNDMTIVQDDVKTLNEEKLKFGDATSRRLADIETQRNMMEGQMNELLAQARKKFDELKTTLDGA